MRSLSGQLAQLVEQRIENPRVRGSIPRLATRIQADPRSFAGVGFSTFRAKFLQKFSPVFFCLLSKPLPGASGIHVRQRPYATPWRRVRRQC